MLAAVSFALLALATGPANAQFCFIKERKCLPGVELSVDYDEIGTLLGITKSVNQRAKYPYEDSKPPLKG